MHRQALIVAALALVSGCSTTVAQCKPCMSSGFVDIQAGRQPAGSTVRVCVEHLGCTERAFAAESDKPAGRVELAGSVRLQQLDGMNHAELGGLDVTATLTPPPQANAQPQTVHATTRYTDGGDGTCACSYLSADTITFRPTH